MFLTWQAQVAAAFYGPIDAAAMAAPDAEPAGAYRWLRATAAAGVTKQLQEAFDAAGSPGALTVTFGAFTPYSVGRVFYLRATLRVADAACLADAEAFAATLGLARVGPADGLVTDSASDSAASAAAALPSAFSPSMAAAALDAAADWQNVTLPALTVAAADQALLAVYAGAAALQRGAAQGTVGALTRGSLLQKAVTPYGVGFSDPLCASGAACPSVFNFGRAGLMAETSDAGTDDDSGGGGDGDSGDDDEAGVIIIVIIVVAACAIILCASCMLYTRHKRRQRAKAYQAAQLEARAAAATAAQNGQAGAGGSAGGARLGNEGVQMTNMNSHHAPENVRQQRAQRFHQQSQPQQQPRPQQQQQNYALPPSYIGPPAGNNDSNDSEQPPPYAAPPVVEGRPYGGAAPEPAQAPAQAPAPSPSNRSFAYPPSYMPPQDA